MKPRSLAEAKALGAKHYFTGKPCRNGHVSGRLTSSRKCIECGRQHGKTWYAGRGKAILRDSKRLRSYGITREQFDSMLASQQNQCGICSAALTTGWSGTGVCVDHNHETSKVRGLLCNHCNRGLGLFRDSPQILASAIAYLEKHRDT